MILVRICRIIQSTFKIVRGLDQILQDTSIFTDSLRPRVQIYLFCFKGYHTSNFTHFQFCWHTTTCFGRKRNKQCPLICLKCFILPPRTLTLLASSTSVKITPQQGSMSKIGSKHLNLVEISNKLFLIQFLVEKLLFVRCMPYFYRLISKSE